jgi:hypothetical protein
MPRLAENQIQADEVASEIKADFMTVGGGIILAVTIVATLFLIFSLLVPVVDRLQFAIIAILTGACWLYMINRFSEKLKLKGDLMEFDTALGRKQVFNLDEIMGLRLTDLGWSLNGDFFVLEISVYDKPRPMQIGLGPCWKRTDLSSFIRDVGKKLENSNQNYALQN